MTDLPTIAHTGTMQIGDLELTTHVLSDGSRVIPAEDMERALRWIGLSDAEIAAILGGHKPVAFEEIGP